MLINLCLDIIDGIELHLINIVVHRWQQIPFLLVSGAINARLLPYFGWILFHVQHILQ